jgi:hypothetical protein
MSVNSKRLAAAIQLLSNNTPSKQFPNLTTLGALLIVIQSGQLVNISLKSLKDIVDADILTFYQNPKARYPTMPVEHNILCDCCGSNGIFSMWGLGDGLITSNGYDFCENCVDATTNQPLASQQPAGLFAPVPQQQTPPAPQQPQPLRPTPYSLYGSNLHSASLASMRVGGRQGNVSLLESNTAIGSRLLADSTDLEVGVKM